MAISRAAHRLSVEGRPVFHMEFGQPSTGAPPRAIAAAHARLDSEAGGYWESPALRERIAALYRDRHGLAIDADRILLTCGASPALALAIAGLFCPGDRIAFVRPGYVAYRNAVAALGRVPVEIGADATTRYQIDARHIEALDEAPAGLIVASPANPTGSMIDAAGLAALAATAARRGVRIIADEIYHGLDYGAPAHSMLEFDPDAIVINSFSKYWSMPGWRLGWIVAPPGTADHLRAYVGSLYLTPPTLSQHAALVAMDETDVLEGYRETYRRNRAHLLDTLPQLGLGRIAPPDGAFYIWADVGDYTRDSMAFCQKLLAETGVAIAPGIDFDPVEGHHFVRFSFAVSEDRAQAAMVRFGDWLGRQARPYAKNTRRSTPS
ncbi:pyridoxal phosphate-dependent aminotransferase [Polymorphobacter fuscus]|nr:aminotransferase class I/II-fold pyridoxal phosphate-dependent enzyme [Polymorphobacter fuscus]NJC09361.1 aspartate/methionine/tyrosine aminotransferase [Polymorphobacter fuscus]